MTILSIPTPQTTPAQTIAAKMFAMKTILVSIKVFLAAVSHAV